MRVINTDRHGGKSFAPYNSLNISFGVGDDAQLVAENRKSLKKQYLLTFLISARQVHGDRIFVAREDVAADLEVEGYDALTTNQSDVGLLIQQADCQGITLYDPKHSAIAAVHSGWKGSVLNITGKTIKTMMREYGSSPADLHATISPSLGPCCAEFVNHALELPESFLPFQTEKNYFDFWQITHMQLCNAGLKESNIQTAGVCTSCSEDYFSYRRTCREGDGATGRCATIIAL